MIISTSRNRSNDFSRPGKTATKADAMSLFRDVLSIAATNFPHRLSNSFLVEPRSLWVDIHTESFFDAYQNLSRQLSSHWLWQTPIHQDLWRTSNQHHEHEAILETNRPDVLLADETNFHQITISYRWHYHQASLTISSKCYTCF